MDDPCLEIEPLLAGYALEALSLDERLLVESHLETCDSCQAALADYQAVSDGLAAAVPPLQPSARLRARLLEKTLPAPQKLGQMARLRSLFPRLAATAGLAVILVLAVLNINLLTKTNHLIESQETLAQQNKAYQTGFALMTYPGSQVAVIQDDHIYGTLIYDPAGQVAVLNVWGLDALPKGQDYQVWLIEPDEDRLSGGVFRSLEDSAYVSFVIESPASLDSFDGIGVTIEPEGGSPGPTGPRVFGVEL